MDFVKLTIETHSDYTEIFTAELAEIGFDTFEETDLGLNAYIPIQMFHLEEVEEIFNRYSTMVTVKYTSEEIEKENWNEDWEKNYHPVEVGKRCRVRATFHEPDPSFDHEIIITPKMSFGTGHHATTHNMLELLLDEDLNGKTILDVGAGTGVLAIMAHKLGASHIEATDIDPWCIENGTENFELNHLPTSYMHLGEIHHLKLEKSTYDVVIANINKNVLLAEIPHYSPLLQKKGILFLSGFYEHDIADINKCAAAHNLSLSKTVVKDNWAALKLVKS